MFFIIILIFVLCMVLVVKNSFNTFGDYVMFFVCNLVGWGLAWAAVFGLATWYASDHPSPVRQDRYDIVALSTGSETSGQFFLGFGYVNSEPMYYYYYQAGDGLRMDYTNADLTVVKQDATPDTSYIVYYCEDYKTNSFFAWPFHDNQWSDCFNYVNEIHIPPNSIDTDFNANLPNQ